LVHPETTTGPSRITPDRVRRGAGHGLHAAGWRAFRPGLAPCQGGPAYSGVATLVNQSSSATKAGRTLVSK